MGFGFGMGFNQGFGMFNVFGIMFTIVFVLVIGTFIVIAVKGIGQWNKNNNSPRLTVPATVVAKRTNVSRHRHGGANGHHHHSHSYHITFETQDGERIELRVKRYEYNELPIGDKGMLTHQGTRYKGFERL